MTTSTYTELPYVFDLLHDIKSLELLHGHLTGALRLPTSSTDAEIVQTMLEEGTAFPEGYQVPTGVDLNVALLARYQELLTVVKDVHQHAKRHGPDDQSVMDTRWVLTHTGEVLSKQPGLQDAERQAYAVPSPFL